MALTVNIGEMVLSRKKDETLVTYSLGSCLGLTIYDPVAKLGGMIHCQLPDSSMNAGKAHENPAMFVNTGVPALFLKAYGMGAQRTRIIVKMAGCTNTGEQDSFFRIGERNYIMARKLLWKNGIFISGEDIGGNISRTLYLDLNTGIVTIKSGNNLTQL